MSRSELADARDRCQTASCATTTPPPPPIPLLPNFASVELEPTFLIGCYGLPSGDVVQTVVQP